MRTRVAMIGASVVLAVGGLAACSPGRDVVRVGAAPASPATVLERAAANTVAAKTSKVSATLDVSGVPGATGPVTVSIDGAIDNVASRSQLTFDLSRLADVLPAAARAGLNAAFGDGPVQVVTDGTDIYMKLGGLSSILGATSDKSWVKISAKEGVAAAAGASLADGTEVLKLLGQTAAVRIIGSEQVRGVDTTHYRGSLDLASALGQIQADGRAEAEDKLGQLGIDPSTVSLPVDVWIGHDNFVRRVQLAAKGSDVVKSGDAAALAATFTMELYDFGAAVDIAVPPADQVFPLDSSIFGRLGGFAGFTTG